MLRTGWDVYHTAWDQVWYSHARGIAFRRPDDLLWRACPRLPGGNYGETMHLTRGLAMRAVERAGVFLGATEATARAAT